VSVSFVSDIMVGVMDRSGAKIVTVYGEVDALYAVYRTPERVVVHFADDPVPGGDQRQAPAGGSAILGGARVI
jgi:hypothetical protein